PKANDTLKALLTALANLKKNDPSYASKLRFHFVGTGGNPNDSASYAVQPLAAEYNLDDIVEEHPARIPYLDVLNNLKHAHAPFIFGSNERHYSPSKVFQSVLSKRPLLVVLHAESTAVQILKEANTGVTVTYDDSHPVRTKVNEIETAIRQI